MSKINRSLPLLLSGLLVFGRWSTMLGWGLFGILMIFASVFGGNADTSFLYFYGDNITVEGKVIEVVETNMEINERSVYATVYEFKDILGNVYGNDAFSTGNGPKVGSTVVVEYPVGKPQHSRVQGMRSAEFSSIMLLMYLLPLSGVGFLFFGIKKGLQDRKLLKNGILTKGTLVAKDPTGSEINGEAVYKLVFEYQAENGKSYKAIAKTHETDKLEDEEHERLFYLSANPTVATMVDDLPGAIEVDHDGQVISYSKMVAVRSLIIPIICVVPHVIF